MQKDTLKNLKKTPESALKAGFRPLKMISPTARWKCAGVCGCRCEELIWVGFVCTEYVCAEFFECQSTDFFPMPIFHVLCRRFCQLYPRQVDRPFVAGFLRPTSYAPDGWNRS